MSLDKDVTCVSQAMFSGRHRVTAREDGSYFLDRDPNRFRHVLNYLRDGEAAALPRADDQLRAELAVEAEYYGLEGMRRMLEGAYPAYISELEGEDVIHGPLGPLRQGSVVVRGPDWKWSMQDGGPGTRGRVAAIGQLGGVPGWVQVKWPNGHFNGYGRPAIQYLSTAVSDVIQCSDAL